MGMTAQQILAQDPEYLQKQLYQQEMQRLNPSGDAAGAIGALLGRGLGNVTSGRGFFDIADPALQRVSQVQQMFNETMKTFDPTNPAASYEEMASKFAQMGMGQQAYMASQEAAKLRQQQRQEQRSNEELDLRRRQVLLEEINKDPYGSIAKALEMPEDSPLRNTILAGASARIGEKNFDQAVKQAQIDAANAQRQKALQGEVSENVVTAEGFPLSKRGDKYYTMDGKVYTGSLKKLAPPNPYAALLEGGGGTNTANDPFAAARAEYERRNKNKSTIDRQRAQGTTETTYGPTGETETRIVGPTPATTEQVNAMSLSEFQEYNRTGRIPERLMR